MLYTHVSDINFLNATSLTRSAFHQLLRRFSRFYYIPRSTARGRPPKLRHYHQIMGLVLCFYVGSMEQTTLSHIRLHRWEELKGSAAVECGLAERHV
uniref:Uncharacterized protein n=1 Tax=Phytophthora fragariae TaxID=53985 RepID=A0A6A3EKY0_9STRA|nr:hypothetical protein PF009_g16914 [Phytophthora fragariae]